MSTLLAVECFCPVQGSVFSAILVFTTALDAGPCTLQAGAGSSSTVLLEKSVSSIATLHCYPGTGI